MHVWHSLDAVTPDLRPSVVIIGNFDGVHRGHRLVIEQARAQGAQDGSPVVAVTFDPHPMRVLLPERAPLQLTTVPRRAELLVQAGVDHVLVLRFDADLAAWTPREFVQRVLIDGLRARHVVVGENFRFGARAAGDTETLTALGDELGMQVSALPLAGAEHPWSSSYVRQCLTEGDVVEAARVLGREHAVSGVVVEGDRRGRELGFPTANVPTDGLTAVPRDGVYAGWFRRLDDHSDRQPAAISVGTNPTFHGVQRRVEAYVLDRTDLELYGVEIEMSFAGRLRGQETYDSADDLVSQMHLDVEAARRALGVA